MVSITHRLLASPNPCVWRFFFTGLWPELRNGNYPCDCTSEGFNANEVSSIRSELNTYWPSLNGPNPTFWSHEWSKHGTCATQYSSQLDYFSGTLALRDKYDAVSALAKVGIYPSNTKGFTLQALKTAMSNAYGVKALVTCDKQGRIQEVWLCIGKDLQPTPCNGVNDNCNAQMLYLPASM